MSLAGPQLAKQGGSSAACTDAHRPAHALCTPRLSSSAGGAPCNCRPSNRATRMAARHAHRRGGWAAGEAPAQEEAEQVEGCPNVIRESRHQVDVLAALGRSSQEGVQVGEVQPWRASCRAVAAVAVACTAQPSENRLSAVGKARLHHVLTLPCPAVLTARYPIHMIQLITLFPTWMLAELRVWNTCTAGTAAEGAGAAAVSTAGRAAGDSTAGKAAGRQQHEADCPWGSSEALRSVPCCGPGPLPQRAKSQPWPHLHGCGERADVIDAAAHVCCNASHLHGRGIVPATSVRKWKQAGLQHCPQRSSGGQTLRPSSLPSPAGLCGRAGGRAL